MRSVDSPSRTALCSIRSWLSRRRRRAGSSGSGSGRCACCDGAPRRALAQVVAARFSVRAGAEQIEAVSPRVWRVTEGPPPRIARYTETKMLDAAPAQLAERLRQTADVGRIRFDLCA